MTDKKPSEVFWPCTDSIDTYRENLGSMVPLSIYRLLEYTLRDTLEEQFGTEMMIKLIRDAGWKAGRIYANKRLKLDQDINAFIAELQESLIRDKIGILRLESFEPDTGVAILTVSEDLDCSGLPVLGDPICNYDEGFIAAILSVYTKKDYIATEIDCWATGSRTCRFEAKPKA